MEVEVEEERERGGGDNFGGQLDSDMWHVICT